MEEFSAVGNLLLVGKQSQAPVRAVYVHCKPCLKSVCSCCPELPPSASPAPRWLGLPRLQVSAHTPPLVLLVAFLLPSCNSSGWGSTSEERWFWPSDAPRRQPFSRESHMWMKAELNLTSVLLHSQREDTATGQNTSKMVQNHHLHPYSF